MTDKQIKKLNELTEMSQELGLYEDRPDWRITLQADHIKRLEEELKAKEQECEELKAKFQDMKKSRDIALKEYNEEFEYKRQITVEHLEQKKELLKQLDQLKTENEELKKQNNQFDNGINEQFSKIIELEGRNNFLKQILTEIKEIIEQGVKIHDDIIVSKQILQKISECEGNDG